MECNDYSKKWIISKKTNFKTNLKLFCLPYAGGGATIFNGWQKFMPDGIEICAIQLPGREHRMDEIPFTQIATLVDAIYDALKYDFNPPFALFGHSLGAKIAFELAYKIREKKNILPVILFVAGCNSPELKEERSIHNLPDDEFINEIRRFSAMSKKILNDREILEMIMPLLRADFCASETYICANRISLNCPIKVYGSTEDTETTSQGLDAWRFHTSDKFMIEILEGDHFFIKSSQEKLLQSIAKELLKKLNYIKN